MIINRLPCLALIALLAIGDLGSANAQSKSKSVYDNAVRSVVAIVPDLEGDDNTIGTGWVLDAKRKLILTNQHVIQGATKCRVYFPLMKDGELVSDQEATLDEGRAIMAEVVDSSVGRDLALIRIDSLPEGTPVLRLSKSNASPGETIHSIAGSAEGTQGLWAYSTGHVRQRVMGGLANGGHTMLLESDMATNRGNSGGPVLNDRGEVVAVVEGHMEEARLVSIYVDRESIVEYLGEAQRCIAPKTTEDYLFAARRNQQENRPELAVRMCSKAIKMAPSAKIYCLRAELWMMMDESDLAGGDLDDALELDPDNAYTHLLDGRWHYLYGDDEDALVSFNDAIRLAPEDPVYRLARANFRFDTSDFEGAMSDVRSLERGSRMAESLRLQIKLLKGKCLYYLDNDDESATLLVECLQANVHDYDSMIILAWLSQEYERNEVAPIYFEAAIRFDPRHQDPRAFTDMIQFYVDTEQYAEAFEASDRMTDVFPKEAFGWFIYGLGFTESDHERAIKFVRHATELDPENERYQEVLRDMIADNKG